MGGWCQPAALKPVTFNLLADRPAGAARGMGFQDLARTLDSCMPLIWRQVLRRPGQPSVSLLLPCSETFLIGLTDAISRPRMDGSIPDSPTPTQPYLTRA